MYELNNTSAFEPLPRWDCNHSWIDIGLPVTYWASSGTDDNPLESAPTTVKRKCVICGGVEWCNLEI